MTEKIAVLVSLLMFVCETFGLAAEAKSLRHHGPRRSIAWPYGCVIYPIDDAAKNKHKLERTAPLRSPQSRGGRMRPSAATTIMASVSSWGRCRTLGFCRSVPANSLVELDCGAGAYDPFKVYVLYDETKSPVTAKLLRFPYYPFGSLSDPDHAPPLTSKTGVIGRAFNRRRGELIVFAKFRGLGDCGVFARYVFPGDEPVLQELRVETACDDRRAYAVLANDPPNPKGWRRIVLKEGQSDAHRRAP